jgi:hypothetical protein
MRLDIPLGRGLPFRKPTKDGTMNSSNICKTGPRDNGRKTKGKKKVRAIQAAKARVKAFKAKYA